MNYRCDLDGHRPAARGGLGDDSSSSGDNAVRNLSSGYQIKWQLKVFAVLIGRCLCAQRVPFPMFLQALLTPWVLCASGFSVLMTLATMFGGRAPVARACHMMIWMALAVGTSKVVLMHGPEFVCKPQLCPEMHHGSTSGTVRGGVSGHLL